MRTAAGRAAWLWAVAIIGSAVITGLLTLADLRSPVRVVSALWFLLVCPGMAVVRVLRLRDTVAEWTLAIALSLGLDALVAEAMLYAGVWSPASALLVLMGISTAGAVLQLLPSVVAIRAWPELGTAAASSPPAARPGASATRRAADHRSGEPFEVRSDGGAV